MVVNGHRLNIQIHGPENGPVVLLLHHGLGSVRAWKAQVPVLAAAGFRVVAYDRWGYGASQARPGLDIPQFEDDLRDLDALVKAQPGRVHLVGHSDGGTIALLYAARSSDRLASLAIIAAHAYVEPKMAAGIRAVQHNFQTNSGFRAGLERVHGEKVEQVFNNWFNGWLQPGNRSWQILDELGTIACPALVVQGLEDEHAAPEHTRRIAHAMRGAQVWMPPEVDHMLPQSIPVQFNEKLVNFLRAVENSGAEAGL